MPVAGGMVAGAGVGVTFKATMGLLLQAVAPVPSVMMFGGFMLVLLAITAITFAKTRHQASA
ncbi:hypothetical protein [Specibacter sp. NPDC078709]